jgi:hypothetical protein
MSAWLDAALGHALRGAAPAALHSSDTFLKGMTWPPLQEDASFHDHNVPHGGAYPVAENLSLDQVR